MKDNRAAIRMWLTDNRSHLTGRVLDFGCGRQPYRDLVAGNYHGYDPNPNGRADYPEAKEPPAGSYDAILMTQMLQAVDNPFETIAGLRPHLKAGGVWIVTYNASYHEVEPEDKWRFSKRGMEALLAGPVICHDPLFELGCEDRKLVITYGCIAKNA